MNILNTLLENKTRAFVGLSLLVVSGGLWVWGHFRDNHSPTVNDSWNKRRERLLELQEELRELQEEVHKTETAGITFLKVRQIAANLNDIHAGSGGAASALPDSMEQVLDIARLSGSDVNTADVISNNIDYLLNIIEQELDFLEQWKGVGLNWKY